MLKSGITTGITAKVGYRRLLNSVITGGLELLVRFPVVATNKIVTLNHS